MFNMWSEGLEALAICQARSYVISFIRAIGFNLGEETSILLSVLGRDALDMATTACGLPLQGKLKAEVHKKAFWVTLLLCDRFAILLNAPFIRVKIQHLRNNIDNDERHADSHHQRSREQTVNGYRKVAVIRKVVPSTDFSRHRIKALAATCHETTHLGSSVESESQILFVGLRACARW